MDAAWRCARSESARKMKRGSESRRGRAAESTMGNAERDFRRRRWGHRAALRYQGKLCRNETVPAEVDFISNP